MQASPDDLVFDLPDGYVEQQRTGAVIVIAPAVAHGRTPCLYGLAGRIASSGNLEADAEADERVVHPTRGANLDRYAGVRHRGRVANKRLDAAEALAEREDLDSRHEAPRRLGPTLEP